MNKVFVVDKKLKPCDPVNSAVARILLKEKKATVYKHFPFTIKLKLIVEKETEGLQLKIDPGSKVTGIAIVNHATGEIIFGAELGHRGWLVKKKLFLRRIFRKHRRHLKSRYRQVRFLNRTKPSGWTPPSLISRVNNIMTWVNRLSLYCSIKGITVEHCGFDPQKITKYSSDDTAFNKNELGGYEIKEYLLEKYNYKCAYCSASNLALQVDHIIPQAKGGSNRVGNLTIACKKCNQKKGSRFIEDFLRDSPDILKKIKGGLQESLLDSGVMNHMRWKIVEGLLSFGLPLDLGTGASTRFNRNSQKLVKSHWLDAACVGTNTPILFNVDLNPLLIKATGRGNRQKCRTDKYGFPKCHLKRDKVRNGFQTGDIVKTFRTSGKYKGLQKGRLVTGALPYYTIGKISGIHFRHITLLQKSDGYSYSNVM